MDSVRFVNQPFSEYLGNILIQKLYETGQYNCKFTIVSAFSKDSGVLRLKPALCEFKKNGGSVDAFIGVDAHGTSYEALVNLLAIVDNLYIIHDNNISRTFHSKVYCFSMINGNNIDIPFWMAIGSNNLTCGGLWTNIETASIIEENSPYPSFPMISFMQMINNFVNPQSEICRKIICIEQIDELLNCGLIKKEAQIIVEKGKTSNNNYSHNGSNNMFGTIGRGCAPRIKREPKGETIQNTDITAIEPIQNNNNITKEVMWFETKAMTGGSRNILDLSMLGTIICGTCDNTRYETTNPNSVIGSIAFFDISPNAIDTIKDIVINYKGKDYYNCTIKFPQNGTNPNGSWRIQFKGITNDGEKISSAEAPYWLTNKIIILEKIFTDYYSMSVLPESDLETIMNNSIFVAHNGNSLNSKKYGLLSI